MIQNQSCRNFLALIFQLFVLFNNPLRAQLSIDTSAVPSGILWKQSRFMSKPPSTGDTIDYDAGWQAIKSLLNSRLAHDGIGVAERRKMARVEDEAVNTVVMFPTALRYQYLNGAESTYFDSIQGNYFVPSVFIDSVYKSQIACFVALSASTMRDRQLRFVVSDLSQWSNIQGFWEADFQDGLGWKLLEEGVPNVVIYDNPLDDKIIRFRFTSDEGIFFSSTQLKGSSVTDCNLLPHSPPWLLDENLPWRISTSYQGQQVSGNAYTLWSDDGIFDKPFLFVEGIDFNMQQWHAQIGDFGWCQFMGNDQANYPMLAQSSDMVDALRERGYDLILLDFVDGAADIRSNAALVKHLIQLCNAYKEGQNQLVVAGASMGGQVVRVALAEMERDGQDHCTGVYVSWDSPHQGAHIPLAIQTTIDFLSPFSAEAEAFELGALTRPAARQMLVNQYFDPMGHTLNPTAFDEFQNYLLELGMPKKTINWAIANGSGIGTPIESTAWTPLLETSCNASNIFSGDEFRMWLYAAPGNPDHAFSTSETNVIADLIYSETYSSSLSFAYIEYTGVYSISSSAPALDYRPGGFRTSIKELVDVVNGNSDYLSECNFISSDEYALKHSFITPQSALDFRGNQNIGILDALVADPNTTPFDDWYVPAGVNQPHVAMTTQNIQWLLNKIDAMNDVMTTEESFPCSPYRYGSPEDEFLFPTTITGIQEVVLNGQGLIHCSQSQQVQIPHLKMRLLPHCNHSGFVLKDKTVLKIGEPDGSKTCQLRLSPESSIIMYDKSRLILGLGSQIIVGPGSRIILEDLSSILNLGGEIIVQEGGQIYFNGSNLSLEHDQALLILDEGLLRIADGRSLALQPAIGATGMMVIKSQHQPAVEFGMGSKLILRGESRDEDVLRIDTMSNFFSHNDFQGSVFIENGAVRFEKDAQWRNQTLVKLEEVKLYAVGSYENQLPDVVFQNNKILMTGCLWHHISVSGSKSHLRSYATRWIGNEIQQWVKGSLTITDSDMIGVGWECEFVGLPFSFRSVTFSGNGNPFGMRVIGLNTAPLVIEECDFSDYDLGLFQSGGELKVACSRFSQLSDAMVLLNGTRLIMNDGAGGNAFENNNRHIVFNDVPSPGLLKGGNWFGSSTQFAIYGLLTVPTPGAIMDWSGNDWLGNTVYVESYFQPQPNELSVNAIALTPTQPFQSCHELGDDVKSKLTASSDQVILRGEQDIARYAVYDARGQLLVRDLDELAYKEWCSKDGVASGLYIVLIEVSSKIQVEKLLIP